MYGMTPVDVGWCSVSVLLCITAAQRLDLFAWRVRLCRLLVGFRMHFKATALSFYSSPSDNSNDR